jgi:hypothetical protein
MFKVEWRYVLTKEVVLPAGFPKGARVETLLLVNGKAAVRENVCDCPVVLAGHDDIITIHDHSTYRCFVKLKHGRGKSPEDQGLQLERVTVAHGTPLPVEDFLPVRK